MEESATHPTSFAYEEEVPQIRAHVLDKIGSSTSLPGGNQVDGLPPAFSSVDDALR